MRSVRTLVLLLSLVVLVFAASGCGGGDGDDNSSAARPQEWAATVCGSLGDWVQSLQEDTQKLGTAMQDTSDLKTVKSTFVTFLENAENSSEELIGKVKETGPPDIENGAEIQQTLVADVEKVHQSFSQAVDKANELPTNNLESFSKGVGPLSTDIQKNLATVGKDFNEIKSQSSELKDAIDTEPACQQFATAG
ncbi:MAG TPA: hypothetical protein VFT86_00595 [Gaiellaceae bacterium]|nr:hypothetical protein [Gaiellaceae bacterium]